MPVSLTDLTDLQVSAGDLLAAVLETTTQPIWVADADGAIRFANPAAVAALGYGSMAELRGRDSQETVHADSPALLPLTTGEPVRRDLDWFYRRDGSAFGVSFVSAPLELPGGRGAVVAFTDIEERLRAEHALQERDAGLLAEQASLRRLATLVTGGAASSEVFAAIAREVAGVLGLPMVQMWRFDPDGMATIVGAWNERPNRFVAGTRWPIDRGTIGGQVKRTGRPARIDDLDTVEGTVPAGARAAGMSSIAGAPIVVDGAIWGVMAAAQFDHAPLPGRLEDRLAEFTELVATAISSTASRQELARLADEQAALRRVATLVARGVPARDVFAAVAREIGLLLGVDMLHIGRAEDDGTTTAVAGWSRAGRHLPAGSRVRPPDESAAAQVLRTGVPARSGGSVGAPIVVGEQLWGVIVATSQAEAPQPLDTETRIAAFTELVGTAITNAEAQDARARMAGEQAALRRVATLVAREVPPDELFGAVTDELCRLLGADLSSMIRYDSEETLTAVAVSAADGPHPDVRGQWPIGETEVSARILHTARSARVDDSDRVGGRVSAQMRERLGIRSTVGSPIMLAGRVWGAVIVHSTQPEPLPADTEARLESFAELVATAMANTAARSEIRRLADDQAALRRVATLVAREPPPEAVFAAVAEEVGRLLDADTAQLYRYEADGTATAVAAWGDDQVAIREPGRRSGAAAPILVAGRLWGELRVATDRPAALPEGTDTRIAEFAELVAAAILNVQARADLAASRARVVAAADGERRRVVRDLHDGAQQRLVHTVITLKLASRALEQADARGPAFVREALEQAERANVELRELAHGILPGVLTRGGLRAGMSALASRMSIPVAVDVAVDRLAPAVEATAYFVVAEALTNVAKHAEAGSASIAARMQENALVLEVRDDGVGGARTDGTGFLGLADRLAVVDGRLHVESPPGGGTLVAATIPAGP